MTVSNTLDRRRRSALAPSALALFVLASCGRLGFDVLLQTSDATDGPPGIDDSGGPRANIAFVTTSVRDGAYGSLDAYDAVCAAEASSAGLAGTYRALMSSSMTTAFARLAGARGWVRVDGRPIVDRVEDFPVGVVFHPISLDPTGAAVPATTTVRTGTLNDGSIGLHCLDYTSASTSELGHVGVSDAVSNLIYAGAQQCATSLPTYCFGIDFNVAVVPASVGRFMFVSDTTWLTQGGIASADATCAADALAAGLPGSYRAWLATTTASASSRFSAAGPTWVRVDGVEIAPTAAEVLAGVAFPALNVTASGLYITNSTWTGASSPTALGTVGTTCSDWSTAASGSGGIGASATVGPFVWANGTQGCGTTQIRCLQD